MNFIDRALGFNYEHVVIEAATGTGKSLIGAAACLRGGHGYYLVTQKLLQDQLEHELAPDPSLGCHLIKSASSYDCATHVNCAFGSLRKCRCIKDGSCSYRMAKANFDGSRIGVTNYAYFITERLHSDKSNLREIMVLDECHTLEKQIIRTVDITVSSKQLEQWHMGDIVIPQTNSLTVFIEWLTKALLPALQEREEDWAMISEGHDHTALKEAIEAQQHTQKIRKALELYAKNPSEWVYWQQEQEDGTLEAVLRPLNAAPFAPLVFDSANFKVHMSAYPGSKAVYCRSLGLDPKKVGWLSIPSPFKKEHRPVLMTFVGQMRKTMIDKTLPRVVKFIEMILDQRASEKGLIHANSYKVADVVAEAIRKTRHASRLIYPKNGEEREEAFESHRKSSQPTIILSPSMTEGYDFAHDLARWQIIAKVPYLNLGDKQVKAKMDQDPMWYQLEAIKTIVQATGRICRAEDDYGDTYLLDADFLMLYEKYRDLFPLWWKEAIVWPGSAKALQ